MTRKNFNSLSQLFHESLNTHDHVTLFTQDIHEVRNFLFSLPGRWNILVNPVLWSLEDFHHAQAFQGSSKEGYKVGITINSSSQGIQEAYGRFMITNNPFSEVDRKTFIIKDTFSLPPITLHRGYPANVALQREGTPIVFRLESHAAYNALHDQFTMQGIDHSLETSGEVKDVHLMKTTHHLRLAKKVLLYGYHTIAHLFPFHNAEQLLLIRPHDVLSVVRFDVLQAIEKCFAESPDSAISLELINFKTLYHPNTLEKNILFLERCGCVTRVRTDHHVITIHKKGGIPDDMEYHMIPEGTYRLQELVSHLKVAREDIFPLLKKYEGKGLIFSYTPTSQVKLWQWKKDLTFTVFQEILDTLHHEQSFLHDIVVRGNDAINDLMNQKIEQHCLSQKTKALLWNQGEITNINPNATLLATDRTTKTEANHAEPQVKQRRRRTHRSGKIPVNRVIGD